MRHCIVLHYTTLCYVGVYWMPSYYITSIHVPLKVVITFEQVRGWTFSREWVMPPWCSAIRALRSSYLFQNLTWDKIRTYTCSWQFIDVSCLLFEAYAVEAIVKPVHELRPSYSSGGCQVRSSDRLDVPKARSEWMWSSIRAGVAGSAYNLFWEVGGIRILLKSYCLDSRVRWNRTPMCFARVPVIWGRRCFFEPTNIDEVANCIPPTSQFYVLILVSVKKQLLPRKSKPGIISLNNSKSGAGEEFLLLDCTAKVRVKGMCFVHRHRYPAPLCVWFDSIRILF